MSEKEIQQLIDLARQRIKRGVSREEALYTFVMAGILDKDGRFTDNFPYLAQADALKNK